MTIVTTLDAHAFAPDSISSYSPTDVLQSAAILALSTKGGDIEGDIPALRVPFIVDGVADIVAEGADITDAADVALDEITINTVKVSKLVKVSREQADQQDAANRIAESIRRSIVSKADALFLSQAAPVAPATVPPAGLVALITTAGGALGTGLFDAFSAIASLEAEGGSASHWLIHPNDWAILAKIPDETGSNRSALGDLHQSTARTLAGLPVVVNRYATAGKAMLIDSAEIVSAYGTLQLARSDQYLFGSDSVAIRATWRIGWGIPRPTRAGRVLTVSAV